jgi:hypothetical protein
MMNRQVETTNDFKQPRETWNPWKRGCGSTEIQAHLIPWEHQKAGEMSFLEFLSSNVSWYPCVLGRGEGPGIYCLLLHFVHPMTKA